MKKAILVGLIFIISVATAYGGPSISGGGSALGLIAGTYTNTYLCKYTAAGTLLSCDVNPATFQTAHANLTALAGLTFADISIIQLTGAGAAAVLTCTGANQILGINAAGDAFECKSTLNLGAWDMTTATWIIPNGALALSTVAGRGYFTVAVNELSIGNGAASRYFPSFATSGVNNDTNFNIGALNFIAGSITAGDVANDNYLRITNNAGGRAPGGAGTYELYPDAGIWKANVNNTEYVIPLLPGTLTSNLMTEKLATFSWDGGGAAVTTGATTKRCTVIPYAATVTGVYAIADASTTTHWHVYQDAYAAGARSTTVTGAVDIGATLGSLDTTLTSWDKSITAGDEICISVETNNNAKWLNVVVYGTR